MRIVVTGATGIGTSVIEALSADAAIDSIAGLARRKPSIVQPKTSWVAADVGTADLVPIFRGAHAIVHLAWLIQPSRDSGKMRRTERSVPMKRKTWTVEPRPNAGWAVQRDGTKRADSLHSKKTPAITRAVELGKGASPHGQVRIKDERGKIVDERTYGNDPRKTPG